MPRRKTNLQDYTMMEREGFAKLWDRLATQATTDGERVRRVHIAQDWRHSPRGVLQDFVEDRVAPSRRRGQRTDKEMPNPGSADAQSSPPLNRYVPHE